METVKATRTAKRVLFRIKMSMGSASGLLAGASGPARKGKIQNRVTV
jgi:hypothetical protein